MKWLRRVLVGLVSILVVAGFAARRYLTSRRVADQVVAQLSSVYGGPVKVSGVDIGLGGSSLSGFELYETGAAGDQAPWLTVQDLNTDISVFTLLHGTVVPGDVRVTGAKVLLRFDREGKLLTSLPSQLFQGGAKESGTAVGAIPEIALQRSQLIFRKEGADDLVLDPIDVKLTRQQGHFVLSGAAANAAWGPFTLAGQFGQDSTEVRVDVTSGGAVHVTAAMLNQVPFVPASIWRAVRIAEGDTPVRLQLRYDLQARALHYQVALTPANTKVEVAAVELQATDTRGQVNINDQLVQLRGVEGKTLGGTLGLDGDLDFRSAETRLGFPRLEATGLDVSRFPASWEFPRQITGKLRGKAALAIRLTPGTVSPLAVADLVSLIGGPDVSLPGHLAAIGLAQPTSSKIHTEGTGKAQIVDAYVAGQPTAAPIEITLHAVPGSFRFGGMDQGARLPALRPAGTGTPAPSANVPFDKEHARAFLNMSMSLLAPFVNSTQDNTTSKKAGPSTIDISLKMKDVDLGKFEQEMNVKLPFYLAGKVSIDVKVAIPLDDSRDLKKYKVHGSVQLTDFVLGDLKLQSLDADVDVKNGLLSMSTLKGQMPSDPGSPAGQVPATFAGAASMPLDPVGDLKAKVTFEHIPVSQLARLVGAAEPVQGDVSGSVTALVPGISLTDSATWQAQAEFTSARVAALGLAVRNSAARLRLDKGTLELIDFRANLDGAPVTAAVRVRVVAPFAFGGEVKVHNVDLSAAQRLAPKWRLPVTLEGILQTSVTFKGTVNPFQLTASGTTQAAGLKVERFSLQKFSAGWAVDRERITINDLSAHLYDGLITGSAVLPLKAEGAGTVHVQVDSVDAAMLARDLPAVPVKVEGKVSGRLDGSMPAVTPGKDRKVQANIDLKAPELRIQGVPATKLHGTAAYQNGVVDYHLTGETLGGSFDLEGQVPSAGGADKQSKKGRLKMNNLGIRRLLAALNTGEPAQAFDGRIDLDVDFTHDAKTSWPEGTGRLRFSNVRYHDIILSTELASDVSLSRQTLRLRDLAGDFAGGTVRARMGVNLKNVEQSWYTVIVDGVEAAHVLGPWLGDTVKGALHARLRGKLGAEWNGSVDLEMSHGKVMGLDVAEWHLPLVYRYDPADGDGDGEITVRESSAQAGRGKITGKLTLTWNSTMRVEGQVKLTRVDLQTFLRQTVGSTQLGGGLLDARFDFASSEMRSLNDLTGSLVASFDQAQAFNMPVLKQIAPFLGIGPSTTFQKGNLHGRLARGYFHISSLALEGPKVQVLIQGNVSLQKSLDLDVTAGFGLLVINTPRLIHLHVSGTTHSPTIRAVPLATITDVARLFMLRGILPGTTRP